MLEVTEISLAPIRETTTGDRHNNPLDARWYSYYRGFNNIQG